MALYRCALALLGTAVVSACGGDAAPNGNGAGGPGGPPMAMTVEATTLAAKPVERTTEYIATVKSRRSTNIQPQVEGFITRISARPGQRVSRGTVLMEIDSNRQQATVASLESVRAARAADLQWARQQAERRRSSTMPARSASRSTSRPPSRCKPLRRSTKPSTRRFEEQRVELAYYRVTAPTAGIVGDIPVRVGDRVTRSTMLTTVDENAGLELYINVPVAQAPGAEAGHAGADRRRRGQAGRDDGGQLHLAVGRSGDAVGAGEGAARQLAAGSGPTSSSGRISSGAPTPGLTVPLVAVLRINGQYFAYVVEKGDGGTTVARQRPVQLGTGGRQRLRRARRTEGRRAADRRGHPEDW